MVNGIQTLLPHGYCLSWQADLLLLHVVSDSLIALAYFSIPVTLWVFVRRRTDLGFRQIFVMFGVFILACGITHVMDVWTLWHPDFWLDGWLRLFTAGVSAVTAWLAWRMVPVALALPSPESMRQANEELHAEIVRRRQYEDELQALNDRMKLQIDELESLSYAISHDVRGPLRHIEGFARILADSSAISPDHPALKYLVRIRASVHHLSEIVEGLLAFSHASRSEMRRVSCDPKALIEEVLTELGPEMEGRPIEVRVGKLPAVSADPALLYQAFYNLLANSVKYTRGRDPAVISIDCVSDSANEHVFRIRDNGAGFDMQYADKLFGVFQRLHHVSEFEGTGIGLANVRRIVERHGGRIWADGQVGIGATFFISLPCQPDTVTGTAGPLSSGEPGDAPAFA
jgi:signal transduction histidine kinase